MINRVFPLLAFGCLISTFYLAPAGADLVLTINTVDETWELTGSDSGNVEFTDDIGQVFWTVANLDTDGSIVFSQQDPALAVDGWSPDNNSVLTLELNGDAQFAVLLAQDTTPDVDGLPITVTAIGGPVDYSGHSEAFKKAFESLIGSTIPLATGTNFGGISVQDSNMVTLGDANGDGVFNNSDIASFVLALTDSVAYQAMFPDVDPEVVLDMNSDGGFDNADIAGFVAALTGGKK